ncbi:hypothetical protein D9M70_602960 [compost metagenome]
MEEVVVHGAAEIQYPAGDEIPEDEGDGDDDRTHKESGKRQFEQGLADQAAVLADACGRSQIHHAKYCTYDPPNFRTATWSAFNADATTAAIDPIVAAVHARARSRDLAGACGKPVAGTGR